MATTPPPTVTINGHDYPVFVGVADADIILAADALRADDWSLLDETQKAQALVTASRLFLRIKGWCGGVPDIAAAPVAVQEACAIMAADIAEKPKLGDGVASSSNIKRAKAGSAEVEYFKPTDGSPPISQAAWDTLSAAGLVGCTPPGSPDDGPFVSNGSRNCAGPGAGYDHPPYWNRWDPTCC